MFYCPHDPHFALILAADDEDSAAPSAAISLAAGVMLVVLAVALFGF